MLLKALTLPMAVPRFRPYNLKSIVTSDFSMREDDLRSC